MLSYFAIYQRDSVGVLSTAMPLPIYLRNLYFRYTHRAPQHPGNAPRPAGVDATARFTSAGTDNLNWTLP